MRKRKSTTYGFARTASLVQDRIRTATEQRGFAQSRLLTHWEEIVGQDLAAISRPIEVNYGRHGFGATLSILTTGANAPLLEMQRETLRDRINSVYGYNAIARLRITQTAATGFADGQVDFAHKRKESGPKQPSPEKRAQAKETTRGIEDESLRDALEQLGAHVMSSDSNKG